jgi:indolepyruvate ferredoxin oxidoreductase alpha subunit
MGHRRVVPIIGDSTFFHAGIPPLIEAVHQGLTMTVILLDNGTTAMTGGQSVPHRVSRTSPREVDMAGVIRALGVARCEVFDPHKLGKDGIRRLVERSFTEPGVKLLLYRSPCWLYSPGYSCETSVAIAKGA